MGFLKVLGKWRKVLKLLKDLKAIADYVGEARKDGDISEEEAQKIAKDAIALAFDAKALIG